MCRWRRGRLRGSTGGRLWSRMCRRRSNRVDSGRIRTDLQGRFVDRLKVGEQDAFQLDHVVVVPASVRRTTDKAAGAIVSENHAVVLQRGQNDASLRRISGNIEAGLQTQAQPHRWYIG